MVKFILNLQPNTGMKILSLLLLFICAKAYTQDIGKSSTNIVTTSDSLQVIRLNNEAFKNRLINPEKTLADAVLALKLARKLNYTNGIGESYRVIGVGQYYQNKTDLAIESYLTALTFFKNNNNEAGVAKVYNNIGNLYRDIDFQKSLENFHKSLKIALRLQIKDLISGLYLNIGTVNQRKKNYKLALQYYRKSLAMFTEMKNTVGIIQSQQNLGVVYFNLNELTKAEDFLIKARETARKNGLYNSIASINLTLSLVYISKEEYGNAEKTIAEGASYAKLVKDSRLEYDYIVTSYKMQSKQKNFEKALRYLQQAYKQDSVKYASNIIDKISLLESQHAQLEKQKESELIIARQKNTRTLFWASSLVASLAFFVIFLLVKNVRKTTHTNRELTRLNQEISSQKDDLDRTNQNLEEIIEERTIDLKKKNKKLSEYSSHLSHQIRSPVATLKGLMLLENDNLIDKKEFVEQMGKCINDLDDKIININENLNNPAQSSLISEE
jgi:tetratricopeptide (TPR) repeat protein